MFVDNAGSPRLSTSVPDSQRIAVWSLGKGDYFQDLFTALLWRAFPHMASITWTHDAELLLAPGTLPVGIMSHFLHEQNKPFPAFIPLVSWSAEPYRLALGAASQSSMFAATVVATQDSLQPHELYIPQLFLRFLPPNTPHDLRLHKTDITARPFAVGYVNRNCSPEREALFAQLLALLGPDQAKARSRYDKYVCSFFNWRVLHVM